MRKLVASEWMSLDGVIDATSMDKWFNPYESDDRAEYIRANVHTSDAVLVGRVTYEMLAGYWSQQKKNEFGIADRLNSMPKHVVSTTLKEATWNNSSIIRGEVVKQVKALKEQEGQDIIMFGSATLAKALTKAGLIDEYRLLVHPVIAGAGKRFYMEGAELAKLRLVKTQSYSHGVLLLTYAPVD